MPYIEPSEIERVKQIDLLTYLQQCEPDELVRLGENSYTTKTHDSLKLSNRRWYWWSQGFGGRSALDYLVKVKGMTFLDAVSRLGANEIVTTSNTAQAPNPRKQLELPMPAKVNDAAVAYLQLRGIDPHVITSCTKRRIIYASEKRGIPHVVFVGKDHTGQPRYAFTRAIGSDFMGEVPGSDKRFAFQLRSANNSSTVHIFEGAIDALSYATLMLNAGKDWRESNLLSLGGIPPAGGQREQTRLPQALTQYLTDSPHTNRMILHFDNDEPGINAANMIASALTLRNFDVVISPPPEGKDVNECLLINSKRCTPERIQLNEARLLREHKARKGKRANRPKERRRKCMTVEPVNAIRLRGY